MIKTDTNSINKELENIVSAENNNLNTEHFQINGTNKTNTVEDIKKETKKKSAILKVFVNDTEINAIDKSLPISSTELETLETKTTDNIKLPNNKLEPQIDQNYENLLLNYSGKLPISGGFVIWDDLPAYKKIYFPKNINHFSK